MLEIWFYALHPRAHACSKALGMHKACPQGLALPFMLFELTSQALGQRVNPGFTTLESGWDSEASRTLISTTTTSHLVHLTREPALEGRGRKMKQYVW